MVLRLVAVALTVGLAALAPALAGAQSTAPKKVRVFRVGTLPGALDMVGLGTVRCLTNIKLGFTERGILRELLVDEGDAVKKGQILARQDDKVLRAEILAKKAEVERARLEVLHLKDKKDAKYDLLRRKAISEHEAKDAAHKLELARASLRLIKAELGGLEVKLGQTVLKAPLNGVISSRLADPGEVVGPDTGEVLELISCRKALAEVSYGEKLYQRIRVGRPVLITADALPGREFIGRVHRKSPKINDKDRTFRVKVMLDNQNLYLRPGMFVRATLLASQKDGPLAIPQIAILAELDGNAVVKVIKDGLAQRRKIALGEKRNNMVVVKKGLKPGELVVLEPPQPATPKTGAKN